LPFLVLLTVAAPNHVTNTVVSRLSKAEPLLAGYEDHDKTICQIQHEVV